MKMKLEHPNLGLLMINPNSGSDTKKYFDSEGRIERTPKGLSQIYPTLKRMALLPIYNGCSHFLRINQQNKRRMREFGK